MRMFFASHLFEEHCFISIAQIFIKCFMSIVCKAEKNDQLFMAYFLRTFQINIAKIACDQVRLKVKTVKNETAAVHYLSF